MSSDVFSIGHSNLGMDTFVSLLREHKIQAIADVRSSPFSRRFPCYSRPELSSYLKKINIAYVFLGEELGGRPNSPLLFKDGVADYEAMTKTSDYQQGLSRVIRGRESYRIAMMCSEHDPLHCHRCLMVGRSLSHLKINSKHIIHDGSIESQFDVEERLLAEEKLAAEDFLRSRDERLYEAYERRRQKVAYSSEMNQAKAS